MTEILNLLRSCASAVGKSVVWRSIILTILIGLCPSQAFAGTNGTWIDTTTGGVWSNPANWSGGTIADGQDGVADFSALNITTDNTVHLDSPRTVGTLLFGDTTPSNNWLLDNDGSSANSLNLAVSTGTPLIQVNNGTATISAILTGNQGLTASGNAILALSGASTYSGGTTIANSGFVILNASTAQSGGVITSGPIGTGPVTIGASGTSLLLLGTSPGLTVANPIIVSDLSSSIPSIGSTNTSRVNTFSGNITLGATPNVGKSLVIRQNMGNSIGELDITGNILANGSDTTAGVQLMTSAGGIRLTGDNTYAGGTTVTSNGGGTLILDPAAPSNTVLGTGPVTMSGNLQLRSASAIASNALTTNGGLTISLAGITSATDAANVSLGQFFLNLMGPSSLPNTPYSVSLGTGPGSTMTLHGSIFNIAANGTGNGTLTLGPLREASASGATELFMGGTIVLNSPASSFGAGNNVKVSSGTTLSSNASAALGTGAIVTLNGSGAVFNIGATQQIGSLNGVAGTSVNLNPSGTASQLTVGNGSFPGAIVGTGGSIDKVSSGSLTLSGVNNYSGGTTVDGGTLVFGTASSVPNGPVTINNGATVVDGGAINQTFLNHVASSSTGVVALGATSANALDLSQATGANLGNISLGAAGTVSYTGSLTPFGTEFHFGGGGGALTIGSALKDSALGATGLILDANLRLILSGANSYTGGTIDNGGILQFNGDVAIPSGSGNVRLNSGALVAGGAIDQGFLTHISTTSAGVIALAVNSANSLDLSAATGANLPNVVLGASGSATYSGQLTPYGTSFAFGGAGTLSITSVLKDVPGHSTGLNLTGGLELALNAANTFSGGITLNSGQLDINSSGNGAGSALGTGQLTINGGTIDNTSGAAVRVSTNNPQLWNGNFTFAAGSSPLDLGTGSVVLGAPNIQVMVVGTPLTVGGAITGNGAALTKTGFGTLILTGASTYSGGTTIAQGKLVAESDNALGTGPITLLTSSLLSELDLTNGVTIANPLNTQNDNLNNIVRSMGGNNTYSGPITGSGMFRNDVGGTTLTLAGPINATAVRLYGIGNINLTGSANGIINHDGSGTGILTLSGPNANLTQFFQVSGATVVANNNALAVR